jgi:hypothetical protein
MRLLRVYKSPKLGKKLRAEFILDTGRISHTDFGASGYRDFTTIPRRPEALEVRRRYRIRHQKEEGSALNSPGMLSLHILWGEHQSVAQNVAEYKRKHHI